jgi:hypothetical protein
VPTIGFSPTWSARPASAACAMERFASRESECSLYSQEHRPGWTYMDRLKAYQIPRRLDPESSDLHGRRSGCFTTGKLVEAFVKGTGAKLRVCRPDTASHRHVHGAPPTTISCPGCEGRQVDGSGEGVAPVDTQCRVSALIVPGLSTLALEVGHSRDIEVLRFSKHSLPVRGPVRQWVLSPRRMGQ